MSLRLRLLLAIAFALLVSCALDAALQAWRDAASVRTELRAALGSGSQTAAAMLSVPGPGAAAMAVSAFDGNRHLRATLLDPSGRVLAASVMAVPARPPLWYLRLTESDLRPAVLPVPGTGRRLVLSAVPDNEVEERWSDFRSRVLLLTLLSALVALLCSLVLARALTPLTALANGLARLGASDVRLRESGPPEIAALTVAFNRLAAALGTARAHNASLQTQLERLAEEERAEIARDLHDEVGPLLFAIGTYAATLGAAADPIAEATGEVQARVRDILGRLHGGDTAPTLRAALLGLVQFWRQVRPETALVLSLDEASAALTGQECDTLFRIAQESVSNAVRHGGARRVDIVAETGTAGTTLRIADDGSNATRGAPQAGIGFGLPGMRARAEALGGTLSVKPGAGWTVTATVPAEARCAAA
jgi:two-component system sensor histidine kinase UhpB